MQIESQKNCLDSEVLLVKAAWAEAFLGQVGHLVRIHMPKDCSEPCQIESD